MRLLDKKFRTHIGNYLFQCALASFSILLILLFLDVLNETAIIASLGATAFIVFTMPNAYSSQPRPLIGGYLVGTVVGITCFLISSFITHNFLGSSYSIAIALAGAIAVGIAIFIMVATDTEHAPAAGCALGLVLNEWDYRTIAFILCAVIVMSFIKRILKPKLFDLI